MANKQTLVAQAKQFFHDFQQDLPTTERLYKEMFEDVVQLQSKFSDLYKDIPSDLISAAENGSWEVPSNPDPFFAQMKGLVDAVKQFRQELMNIFRIKAEAGRAMSKFSKFNKDDSWATLSRSDILELRKLSKRTKESPSSRR
ncbi:unnamed protein product [Orchesella dallaii]|uniref:Uncharacterized protein n=1 Tax=Orchesella dallaii TaxID=48710 RepID=A0ABP1PTZ5_9HEXA